MEWNAERSTTLPVRIGIVGIQVAILAYLARHYQIDDALIYARYVANALRGLGLVFNANEHTNSLTSPLYSYLVLGAAKLLHGHVLGATAVVSGMFFFGACAVAESLVAFSGLLLAGTGYFYSLVGMESSTFFFLLLLTIWLTGKGRLAPLPTVLTLLVLTRAEGVAMVLAVAVELYRRQRWPSLASYVPPALIGSSYLILNRRWYGAWIPASAGAKLGQGASEYWGRWPTSFFKTMYQLKPEFLPTLYVVVLVVLLVVPGVRILRGSAINRLGLPFLAVLLAFYVLFNLPGYKWYYSPFIGFAMIYACAAIPGKTVWRTVAAAIVFLSAVTAMRRFALAEKTMSLEGYPTIAMWLDANTARDVRVEAGEIGTVGWFCQRCYLMDILGLTLPKNAAHIAHRDSRSWLAEDRPDYVVAHRGPWFFEDVAKQSDDYEEVPVNFGSSVYLLRRKDVQKGR